MRLKRRWLGLGAAAVVAVAALFVVLNSYVLAIFTATPLRPPTPPILRGAARLPTRTHGSGCPPWDPIELRNPGGIDVGRAFPPGTPQGALVTSLRRQGFKIERACTSDPTIRYAEFTQSGGGFYGPYPANSVITWKTDPVGRLAWVSGWVAYTGP